jgi:septum formation protein
MIAIARADDRAPLVLASSSPRRIELMRMLGVRFSVIPSGIEEHFDRRTPVGKLVERNALSKAAAVAGRLDAGLVIGADTVVVLDGKIYGKPSDIEDARRMLSELSGYTHQVFSGVAVVRAEDGKGKTAHAVTDVTFRPLSGVRISRYFDLIDPLDKAGAYAIQGIGGIIIEKITGCYYNVVGLPLTVLDDLLSCFNMRLL